MTIVVDPVESPETKPVESDDAAESDELAMRPPSGLSPSARELKSKVYPPVTDQEPENPRLQYPISGLMLLTLAVAIGFAGHQYLSAKVFAGVLAIIANIFLYTSDFYWNEDPKVTALGTLICVALCAALVVALFG